MTDYLKVVDHKDLLRHASSRGIVNTNNDALEKYKEEREKMKRLNDAIAMQENQATEIENIKNMLSKILEKLEK